MKKLFFLFVLVTYSFVTKSQSISTFVVSSGGDFINLTNKNLAFTIGELVIPTWTTGNNSLTQGFHQPYEFSGATTLVDKSTPSYLLKVYPNPSKDLVYIDVLGKKSSGFSLEILDPKGSKLSPNVKQNDGTKICFSMRDLVPGSYYVRLMDDSGRSSSMITVVKVD